MVILIKAINVINIRVAYYVGLLHFYNPIHSIAIFGICVVQQIGRFWGLYIKMTSNRIQY